MNMKLNSIKAVLFTLILSNSYAFASQLPVKEFFPPQIKIDLPTTKSQKELDNELENLFSPKTSKDEYQTALKLLRQGAFPTEKALFGTLTRHVKDYRSFQLLYEYGGFDKAIFLEHRYGRSVPKCDVLRNAFKVQYYNTNQSLEKEIKSTTETMLFLKDKINFKDCSKDLVKTYADLAGRYQTHSISLDGLKILLASGVDASMILNEVLNGMQDMKKGFEARTKAAQVLVDAGAKPHSDVLKSYLIESSPREIDGYARFLEVAVTNLKTIDKNIDHALREVKTQAERYGKRRPHLKEKYTKTAAVFANIGGQNLAAKQANDDLKNQLREAIKAKNERRVLFYISRGAKISSDDIYRVTQAGMIKAVQTMLQKQPKDIEHAKLLQIGIKQKNTSISDIVLRDIQQKQLNSSEYRKLLLIGIEQQNPTISAIALKNLPNAQRLENTLILALEKKDLDTAKKIHKLNGLNADLIFETLFNKYGINSTAFKSAVNIFGSIGIDQKNYYQNLKPQ